MGPGYFVIAILGCADGGAQCTPVATLETRYANEANARRDRAGARSQQQFRLPDPRRPLPPRRFRNRRPAARNRRFRRVFAAAEPRNRAASRHCSVTPVALPGSQAMQDHDVMEPMVHEDREPGHESQLEPKPDWEPRYNGSDRLKGKVALITGGDSGIGRARCGAVRPRRRRRRHRLPLRA